MSVANLFIRWRRQLSPIDLERLHGHGSAGVPTGERAVDRRETAAPITSSVAKSFDEVLGEFGVALTRVKTVGVGPPSVAM
jgi:hypothetical protein